MNRGSRYPGETPVVVSLVDTGRSTIKMLVELWYAMWHEANH